MLTFLSYFLLVHLASLRSSHDRGQKLKSLQMIELVSSRRTGVSFFSGGPELLSSAADRSFFLQRLTRASFFTADQSFFLRGGPEFLSSAAHQSFFLQRRTRAFFTAVQSFFLRCGPELLSSAAHQSFFTADQSFFLRRQTRTSLFSGGPELLSSEADQTTIKR